MDYFYLLISISLGVLSHMSRAWRWKYPLEALGYKPRFWNSFFTVMIGYFANLGIPRSGEVLRCGVMSKYENIPFNKLVGTVIAERVADFVFLIASIFLALFLQTDKILELVNQGENKFTTKNLIILVAFFLMSIVGLIILWKSKNKFIIKIRDFVSGIFEGIKTIFTMKKRWLYIGHTFFIWILYYFMFRVAFLGLPELSEVPFAGIFPAFIAGGIGIAVTNGGIGAYPLAVSSVLAIYGLREVGLGFGWAVWVAQSAMLIGLGLISFILIPRFNKSKK